MRECERKVSTARKQCYAVLRAVLALRPFIEGTMLTVCINVKAAKSFIALADLLVNFARQRMHLFMIASDIIRGADILCELRENIENIAARKRIINL